MYYLAIFPPLIGAFLVGLLGRFLGNRLSNLITCTLVIFLGSSVPVSKTSTFW